MKFICTTLACLCLPAIVFCQDISGLWSGSLYNDSTSRYHDYEIGITKEKGKYSGISKTSYSINQQKYEAVKKLKVRLAPDGKIVLEDAELVFYNYPLQPFKNVKQLNVLDLQKENDQFVLSGVFVTNATKKYSPLTGKVALKRKSDFTSAELQQYLLNNGLAKELKNANEEVLAKNAEE